MFCVLEAVKKIHVVSTTPLDSTLYKRSSYRFHYMTCHHRHRPHHYTKQYFFVPSPVLYFLIRLQPVLTQSADHVILY